MNCKKRVLIVEDDRDVSKALAIRFGVDFEVQLAHDGVSALNRVRNGMPDVMVLDLGLPAGDGFRVLECLRDNFPFEHVPVVVFSGMEGHSFIARAMQLGARAVFNKSADLDELLDTVNTLASSERIRRKRVLVVDDDADLRKALTTRLRASEFDVVVAEDGASALIAAKRHRPDVILLGASGSRVGS